MKTPPPAPSPGAPAEVGCTECWTTERAAVDADIKNGRGAPIHDRQAVIRKRARERHIEHEAKHARELAGAVSQGQTWAAGIDDEFEVLAQASRVWPERPECQTAALAEWRRITGRPIEGVA